MYTYVEKKYSFHLETQFFSNEESLCQSCGGYRNRTDRETKKVRQQCKMTKKTGKACTNPGN